MLRILIVPDLKLVACPQEPGSELDEFRERWATFLRHDEAMNDIRSRLAELRKYGYICEVSWALSDDLRDLLLACESPWTLIGKVGWVRDLMITFPGPLSNTLFSTVEFQPNLTIQPNILADYVQPETKEAAPRKRRVERSHLGLFTTRKCRASSYCIIPFRGTRGHSEHKCFG